MRVDALDDLPVELQYQTQHAVSRRMLGPEIEGEIAQAGFPSRSLESGGRFFDRNIWPDFRVFRIQQQPFLKPRLGVGLDRVDRALRLAHPAIDALVRVDDEHVLALVEAVHGAHFDAVHGFAANTTLVDDVGQLTVLSAGRSGELVELQQVSPPTHTQVLANTEVQIRSPRTNNV